MILWLCFCGGVVVFCGGVFVILWLCFCGGVVVFCGGVFVFLWWCFCVFVVVCLSITCEHSGSWFPFFFFKESQPDTGLDWHCFHISMAR